MDIYIVEASQSIYALVLGLTALISASLALAAIWAWGAKGWLTVVAIAIAVPNLIVLVASKGAAFATSPGGLIEQIAVVTLLGVPGAAMGGALGWVLRRRRA